MTSEPLTCDICGVLIGGWGEGRKLFTVQVSDFGIADAYGRFCSMEHAAEWIAGGPELKPEKYPMVPGKVRWWVKGCSILAPLLLILVCAAVGVIVFARAVI